jgi:hypothetical protein
MTPKEKAIEMYNNLEPIIYHVEKELIKRCLHFACNEIVYNNSYKNQRYLEDFVNYWLEVKAEIEDL